MSEPKVDIKVYEAAVKGRQDFRTALRECRKENKALKAELKEYKHILSRGNDNL